MTFRKRLRILADKQIVLLFRSEIETFIERYPKILSGDETLRHLTEDKLSIARFGDGEFRVMMGKTQNHSKTLILNLANV